jgi:hypothetical protein
MRDYLGGGITHIIHCSGVNLWADVWHLLRRVRLSMPSLVIIDFETFWNIETLKATGLRKDCGRYYSKCDD